MIARKTLRETWPILAAYVVLMELMLVAAVFYWPDLRDALAKISKLGFLNVLGQLIPFDFLKRPFLTLVDPEKRYASYIALQHFFKGINIMGIAAAMLLGTFVIARERENGTLEILLSLPASRGRILAVKSLVLAIGLACGIFLTSLSLLLLDPLVGEGLAAVPLLLCSLHGTLTVLLFMAMTILASTFFRTQASVAFAVGVFIAVEFAVYFIQVARNWSFFRLCDFEVYFPILTGESGLPFWEFEWILILGTALCYSIAHRRFVRGDL